MNEMTYNEAIEWMDSRHWSGTGKGIVRSQWINRYKLDIVVLQELLKSKPIAAGRLTANNNLLHFRLIHEFLCPPKESKKSHAGVT